MPPICPDPMMPTLIGLLPPRFAAPGRPCLRRGEYQAGAELKEKAASRAADAIILDLLGVAPGSERVDMVFHAPAHSSVRQPALRRPKIVPRVLRLCRAWDGAGHAFERDDVFRKNWAQLRQSNSAASPAAPCPARCETAVLAQKGD